MSVTSSQTPHSNTHGDHADHAHNPTGWRRWLYSTNHKDIGTLYIIFSVIAGLLGAALSGIMRVQLQHSGGTILGGDWQLYNTIITAHGLIMVFFFVMPDRKSVV